MKNAIHVIDLLMIYLQASQSLKSQVGFYVKMVFIALYWVLLESVELRQAPFILWIDDLSAKDPFYVLPVIMGISMFIQQKLNPAPMDPMQAKILTFLPIVFTLFFAFFPSGLVLYWVANNILSIIQQWHITRKIERAAS